MLHDRPASRHRRSSAWQLRWSAHAWPLRPAPARTRTPCGFAAESGDSDAAYRLGRAYQRGSGVIRDPAEGVRWIRIAAEQAHAEARNDLGRSYANGYGVPLDMAEAVRWFRLAAEQGFAVAQGNLGLAYADGLGVAADQAEALRWFRLGRRTGAAARAAPAWSGLRQRHGGGGG